MSSHSITRTYSSLRGITTDSKFTDPPNVSNLDVNMMRLADGTFSPRRGYQIETNDIGGLGNGIFENKNNDAIEPITIHRDGNLYIEKTGSMTISFDDPNSNVNSYISYEIYVDPALTSDTQTCDFDPFLVVDDSALVTDDIKFRLNAVTGYSGVVIGAVSATYSGILLGFPISPGSILMTDGTLTIQDDAIGGFIGDTGVGTNTINYTTGAYDVTFSGITGVQVAEYRSTLQEQFDQSLGKGFNTASPYSINALSTLISSITGVTVSTTGVTSYPAAFIEIEEETIIPDSGSVTLNWKYWQSANRTVASTFGGLVAQLSSDNFRNATFAPYEEVVYIASKFDEVQKYDGQTIYRAGMPRGVAPTIVSLGAGGVDVGDHSYYTTYEQTDSTGRRVEGRISTSNSITVGGAGEELQITMTNLLQGSGWNTNCAIINGVQSGVNTIVVDDGNSNPHTLQVGDIAYFDQDGAGDTVTRNITATTAFSITIDGNPVNTIDNQPISNNLKIIVYRTKVGGTVPYLAFSAANNSYATTRTYDDSIADSALGADYIIPVRNPDPPPKVGIVKAFSGQVIYTDDPVNEDYVWYSEPSQPEYVPVALNDLEQENSFIIPSNDDDITGAGVSGSTLVIFKDKSIYTVSGDLAASQFEVQTLSPGSNIGCVSHHTIAEVGQLLYFTHTNGVYSIIENQFYPVDKLGNPIPLSIQIDKKFREDNFGYGDNYSLKRATAINYTKDNQYLLFIPSENLTGVKIADNNSTVLCYDYQGKNWFEWTRFNAAGGWYVLNDNLYWQERRLNNDTITSKKYKQHRKYRLIDQVDHVTPIRVTWESSWEDLGQPRVRKKFIRTVLLFDEISSIYQLNQPTLCFYSYKDWKKGVISTRADIMQKINSGKWSSTQFWNWIQWSGTQDSFITIPLKGGTVAKSMQIGMQLNSLNSSFKLQGFQHEVASEFRKTIVR